MERMKALALFTLLTVSAAGAQAADDTALFSTLVAPNVMLLVDNSGSMSNMVWHPQFDPTATPTCAHYNNNSGYSYSSDITLTRCGKTATLYDDPAAPGSVRITGRYLNWIFSPESNAYNADLASSNNGTYSSCIGGGTYSLYQRTRVTAAKDVLREVVCQVNAAGAVRFGMAQFRRPGSNSHTDGGYVRVPAEDFLDASQNPNVYTLNSVTQSHGDHIADAIDELTGESWTPLAESLFQVYTYFMSRDTNDIPFGANLPLTKFPKYTYTTSRTASNGGPFSSSGPPTVPDSPVQYDCQKNFVLIITDGEPTQDNFDDSGPEPEEIGFSDFNTLIGDFNMDGENELVVPWGGNGTRYLDDVAMFMHERDFRPDMDGEQTLDVYTVGFSTSPDANSVLQKTATAGGGQFYFSNNAEQLALDIVSILTDIIRKSHTFTASAVPATRTADGGMFYTSSFIPERDSGYWTGSLRAWKILANGDILGQGDVCALDDLDPGECNSGDFKGSAIPFWEASDQIPQPAVRNLHTSVLQGSTQRVIPFKHVLQTESPADEVQASDLGVVFPPPVTVPGSVATTQDELAAEVVANVRGCRFGTGANGVACIPRTHLLGDIFHSAPVVIPAPRGFQNELSYKQFAAAYSNRQRIVTAGANDGFMRFFDGGSLDLLQNPPRYTVGTGAELYGFMPYAARQNVRHLPADDNARDYYFVDGTPSIADVWFPSVSDGRQSTKSDTEWLTIMMGGMRQGGRSYYALDVTDPTQASYPGYLWEFPREDALPAITDYQGESWSDPIITKIRVSVNGDNNNGQGYERWVAVIGGGYDEKSDPNSHASYDPNHLGGRSIVVLDLRSGEILARKKFDPAVTASPEEADMLYAIPSRPAVYDTNFDGFADLIFIGDLGGNMWKWVITDIADDIVNGSIGDEDQDANWHFKKFFAAPIYDSGTNLYYKSFYHAPSATLRSGTLWVVFGSGERSNLPFAGFTSTQDENNRFYSMTDLDPFEKRRFTVPPIPYPTLVESDLIDHTNDVQCIDLTNYRGFFFRGREGEKWITQSEIFAYYVFVLSYLPTPPASPCEAGGEAWLYLFKVHCGEGKLTNNGNPDTKTKIGDEPPVDPKISIGDDANVLIRHETKFKFTKPKISGQALWRELAN